MLNTFYLSKSTVRSGMTTSSGSGSGSSSGLSSGSSSSCVSGDSGSNQSTTVRRWLYQTDQAA
ncbi:hypothetical protein POR16_17060 [Pseudomonas coronafaciens pv. oryzae str. 1_6]|nr:hypothetical protein POR16_17060 [Pseudomonas coronafaciens pv. oryzae str. 1_6]